MNTIHEYALENLELEGKTILDAAVGQASSTRFWAKAVHKNGGTSRIIGIDNNLPSRWKKKIAETLGEYNKYVELREADIFDLGFLDDASVDIVNCADTLVFLNPTPLRILSALKQFSRVLKEGGDLIITSELPLCAETYSNEGQWLRWNLSKAILSLKGELWSTEIELDDLICALDMTGFEVQSHKLFPESRRFAPESVNVINEWREVMLQEVSGLNWDSLTQHLEATVNEIHQRVLDDGYLLCPAKFVVKCVRKNRDINRKIA